MIFVKERSFPWLAYTSHVKDTIDHLHLILILKQTSTCQHIQYEFRRNNILYAV